MLMRVDGGEVAMYLADNFGYSASVWGPALDVVLIVVRLSWLNYAVAQLELQVAATSNPFLQDLPQLWKYDTASHPHSFLGIPSVVYTLDFPASRSAWNCL
jgi:hypothetical protein